MVKNNLPFWSLSTEQVIELLDTSLSGLSSDKVIQRKTINKKVERSKLTKDLFLFLSQFKSPLTFLLVFALILSSLLGEFTNSLIIFCILFLSGGLGFIQERNAGRAAEKLRKLIQAKTSVKRGNAISDIPISEVVEGDIVLLEAGDIVPADSLIIELKDLYVNEAVLTGESFPSEKTICVLPEETSLIERKNCVFKGTNITSGTATVVAVNIGKETELGKIETEIGIIPEETAFEKGIKSFGYMLMRMALLLAGVIIILNISLGKQALDSVLFALALSVGLAPEMLPAIVTITLSAGAKRLAEKSVIVKKLSAIQNLGAIDVLCCDKTGTLTEGEVKIHSCISADGQPNDIISLYAYLNAFFETGYPNPMDEAIKKQLKKDITDYVKFDEVPYDFIRKRLSIVVAEANRHIMITKGALNNVLEICNKVQLSDSTVLSIENYRDKIKREFEEFSKRGFRTIGICFKDVTGDPVINKDDECEMIFLGFIFLYDPPKQNISSIIKELQKKKVELKIITGDNTLIAENIAEQIGIPSHKIISGKELHLLNDEAMASKVEDITIFSEAEPSQKERIVRSLQKKGHIVGYLGDGINDASALKAADVGISVNNAVDVAKESADMILLEKELSVMSEGITEGRKTYLNTLKYIFITISANFGNMFSMAGASLLLPFLPLLPSQILLTNFLSDLPALSIASDRVDEELLQKPRRWDVKLIRRFMIVFGLESSLFDFITFGILMRVFHATPELFRTGWFIESVITEVLILLVIRSRKTFFVSRPGKLLIISSLAVIAMVFVIPYLPFASSIGLIPIPLKVSLSMCGITALYALVSEVTKKYLFRKMNY
jgi:Mg2+-importing ATPase